MDTATSAAPSVSFANDASRLANQAAQLTIHGGQYNYLISRDAEPPPSRCVSVPLTTSSTYTERHNLSRELKRKLRQPYGAQLAHAVAVVGLGGTGKTQLVLRYLEEHEEEYDTILWLDTRSEETARASFERCRRALRLPHDPSASEASLSEAPAVQTVLHWLRSRRPDQRWLVVLDNANDLTWKVSSIIPHGRAGSVVVTSQDRQAPWALLGISEIIEVEVMEFEEAVSLLHKAVNREESDDHPDAANLLESLVDRLDRLPLAIELAGAQIGVDVVDGEDIGVCVRRYLTELDRHCDSLLRNEHFAHATSYGKTVWSVWEASLASITRIEKGQSGVFPLQLLMLITMLSQGGIEHELFRLAGIGLKTTCEMTGRSAPSWMQAVLSLGHNEGDWDDRAYRASVRLLLRYGLVRPVQGPWEGLTMHSLVRWRASHEGNREQLWKWYVLFITAASFQLGQAEDSVPFRRFLTVHLPANDRLIKEDQQATTEKPLRNCKGLWWVWKSDRPNATKDDVSWQWMIIANIWSKERRWRESETLFAAAYRWNMKALGKRHPDTLACAASLASSFQGQGQYEAAEEMNRRALAGMEKVLGVEHPDTLMSVSNLALVLQEQGQYEAAEEMNRRVLAGREKVLGMEHPHTLVSVSNLANLLQYQGKYEAAEEMNRRALAGMEKVLGVEHPDTLTSVSNLALVLQRQGQYEAAEEMNRRALAGMEKVLGVEHPDTLMSVSNLALVLQEQGQYEAAEEMNRRVLAGREKVLGMEHPHTLLCESNLANLLQEQGQYEAAEEMNRRVLAGREKVLGVEHPDTLISATNLAVLLQYQGKYEAAEEMNRRALEGCEKVLGIEHPYTLTSVSNLGAVLRHQGQYEAAEEMSRRALELREKVLGVEHPDTLKSVSSLAGLLREKQDFAAALPLYERACAGYTKALGAAHPTTRSCTAHMASLRGQIGES